MPVDVDVDQCGEVIRRRAGVNGASFFPHSICGPGTISNLEVHVGPITHYHSVVTSNSTQSTSLTFVTDQGVLDPLRGSGCDGGVAIYTQLCSGGDVRERHDTRWAADSGEKVVPSSDDRTDRTVSSSWTSGPGVVVGTEVLGVDERSNSH